MSADPVTTPQATPSARGFVGSRGRALLSLVPPPVRARRAPFVALLLVLLAAGLVGLLLLNTASAQDAFRLHSLQSQQALLERQRQQFASREDGLDDPARLAYRAMKLGLVPGAAPVFLTPGQVLPKGAIRLGTIIYVPGAVPVAPAAPVTPAPTTKPVAKTPVKKVARTPAAKRPVATATKTPVRQTPVTGTTTTGRVPAKTPTTTGHTATGTTTSAGTTGTTRTTGTGTTGTTAKQPTPQTSTGGH